MNTEANGAACGAAAIASGSCPTCLSRVSIPCPECPVPRLLPRKGAVRPCPSQTPRARIAEHTARVLAQHGRVAPVNIAQRVANAETGATGQGVSDDNRQQGGGRESRLIGTGLAYRNTGPGRQPGKRLQSATVKIA